MVDREMLRKYSGNPNKKKSPPDQNHFIDDEPERFEDGFRSYLKSRGIKVTSYEDFINAFQSYLAGSPYARYVPDEHQPNANTMLPLFKEMKPYVVQQFMENNQLSEARAKELFVSILTGEEKPKKLTGYQQAVLEERVLEVVSKGHITSGYKSEFKVKGKTRVVYRDKNGRFAKLREVVGEVT